MSVSTFPRNRCMKRRSNVRALCRNDGSHDRHVTIPEFRLFPGAKWFIASSDGVLPNQIRARDCEDKILAPRDADLTIDRLNFLPLYYEFRYSIKPISSVYRKHVSSNRRSSQISSGLNVVPGHSVQARIARPGVELIINSLALLLTNTVRQRSLDVCVRNVARTLPAGLFNQRVYIRRSNPWHGWPSSGWPNIRRLVFTPQVFMGHDPPTRGARSRFRNSEHPRRERIEHDLSLSLSLSFFLYLSIFLHFWPPWIARSRPRDVLASRTPRTLKFDAPMEESQVVTWNNAISLNCCPRYLGQMLEAWQNWGMIIALCILRHL